MKFPLCADHTYLDISAAKSYYAPETPFVVSRQILQNYIFRTSWHTSLIKTVKISNLKEKQKQKTKNKNKKQKQKHLSSDALIIPFESIKS